MLIRALVKAWNWYKVRPVIIFFVPGLLCCAVILLLWDGLMWSLRKYHAGRSSGKA